MVGRDPATMSWQMPAGSRDRPPNGSGAPTCWSGAAGVVFILLADEGLRYGSFAWVRALGGFGFWVLVPVLMVLFVTLVVLTKKRPESAQLEGPLWWEGSAPSSIHPWHDQRR